jgi:uncharacterized membrane protein
MAGTPMCNLLAAAFFFLAIHFLISGTRLRDALVARIGAGPYRGAFSIASLIGLAWMIFAYKHAPAIAVWNPLPGMRPLAYLLVFLAFLLSVIGLATPSVTGVGIESKLTEQSPTSLVRGVTRITRHPFLWGAAIWAIAHLLENGDLASIVLFGSLLLLAMAGTVSIDAKRRRVYADAWSRFAQVTSNVPFVAIISGRNSISSALREIGIVKPLVAALTYALVFYFHGQLFGASLR